MMLLDVEFKKLKEYAINELSKENSRLMWKRNEGLEKLKKFLKYSVKFSKAPMMK